MSLGVVIKGPEGLVLGAESRVTLTVKPRSGPELIINYDNAKKILNFEPPNEFMGVVTYGLAAIDQRTAHSFLPEIEEWLPEKRLKVDEFASRLQKFFMDQWKSQMPADYTGPQMTINVAGFNPNEPYGRVYEFKIPSDAAPLEFGRGSFGLSWGGQRKYADRLIDGFDAQIVPELQKELKLTKAQMKKLAVVLDRVGINIPYQALALQDCINLAIFLVRTTIEMT
jgi:hypothetical protein